MAEDPTSATSTIIPNGFMKDHPLPYRRPTATTHDISRSGDHIPNIQAFLEEVQEATQDAFPNSGKSRYSTVNVLLLSWAEDDLKVIVEVERLRQVFEERYGFSADQWSIPSSDSHGELQDRLRKFTKTYGKEDALLIVYYGGHGYLDDFRQPIWLCSQKSGASSLKWYSHQVTLEETKSDVLILLDCCHAGGSSGDASKGTKEVIAACGFEAWAPGVGDHSFTKSLIDELEYLSTGPAFSASSLHSRVLDRLKHWNPVYNAERLSVPDRDGRFRDQERRKCPVYISLNKDTKRRSIEIMSRVASSLKLEFSTATGHADPVNGDVRDHHTKVTIAVQVESGQILRTQDLIAWIREIPLLAKSVKLEAVLESHSTLLLISLPVAVWNLLHDDPACSFVGFTTSSNWLLNNAPTIDDEFEDMSHASAEPGLWPDGPRIGELFSQKRHTSTVRGPDSASSSIIRSWQVTFDQIRVQEPRAAELLSLMAVLDRQGIPKALLCRDDDEKVEITTALGTLQAFSLIGREKEGEIFEIHRLVQLFALQWLERQNEKLKWQEEALQLLSAKFPNGDFSTWETCALYLPHVFIIIDSLKLGPSHANQLGLLENTANFLQTQGQYQAAERIIRLALKLYENAHGNEHSDTLRTMKKLGEICNDRGKYDDAEGLVRRVLESRETQLGRKHEFTLSAISSLARILISKGKYQEAKDMLEQNVKFDSEVLGEEHTNTLKDMQDLAVAYCYLHQLNEAEELQVQVLKARKKALGAEHPKTLMSMANLAVAYCCLNQLSEAERLQLLVLKKRKKVLGAEHPDTLLVMSDIAVTYQHQNRLSESKDLQVLVLEMRKKVLGTEHPDTLLSMANLAVAYFYMNRLSEAEELQLLVLEKRKKFLGAEHPDTLLTMSDIAVTYQHQNRLSESEDLQVLVLEMRKKVLGTEHPDTLWSMANLAVAYCCLNRLSEAGKLQLLVLEKRKKVLGAEHPDTLLIMANLAVTYKALNRLGEAEDLEVQLLRGREKALGSEHPDTLLSMANLAAIYKDLNRWNEAEKLEMQVYEAHKRDLGAWHQDTLMSMANLACSWRKQNHLGKAISFMSDTVRLSETVLGADHPESKRRHLLLNTWMKESRLIR